MALEPQQQAHRPVRILFVCMGNICRSPMAEAVFRSLAQRDWPDLAVVADSAGTHDYHVGHAPDARAQRVARAHGIDLILAMDLQNRTDALKLAPRKRRHRLRLLLDYAPQLAVGEVPDPYYGELSDFERVFDLSEQAARGLLQSLAAQPKLR